MHDLPVEEIDFIVNSNNNVASSEDIEGHTPIHYAVDYDNVSVVKYFVEKFELQTKEYSFPGSKPESENILERCIRKGSWKSIILLLKEQQYEAAQSVSKESGNS